MIILQHGEMEFGILAVRILRVGWLPMAELQASLPTLTGARVAWLKGVTAQRVVVLDAKKLLADPTIVVDEEVTL